MYLISQKGAINCFKVIVLNHITKLSFTWTCSPCEFTIEKLPLTRRPLPYMGNKGLNYLFIYYLISYHRLRYYKCLLDSSSRKEKSRPIPPRGREWATS